MHKVLLIDDDDDVRYLVSRTLTKLGCEVIEVDNAEAGLELIKNSNPFRVIFTDFNMPRMNGVEFILEAKKLHPDACIVFISTAADQMTKSEALNKGGVYCVSNKFSPAELKAGLDEALSE